MHIFINQKQIEMTEGATVEMALALFKPERPFAVALNCKLVHRAAYAEQALQDGDQLEVVQPVAGG
jgi:sulfur carrier protein